MSMLSRVLENSLHRALSFATERGHEYATLEHLLLSLTDDQDAIVVLRACGVEEEKLQRNLIEYLDNELDMLVHHLRTRSRRPDSSECFSALQFMYNLPVAKRLLAQTSSSQCFLSARAMLFIFCRSRT